MRMDHCEKQASPPTEPSNYSFTMDTVVLKMLFIVSVSGQYGKHVYVQNSYEWPDAQKHCRDHYTDLSPITTAFEEKRLRRKTEGVVDIFWIGLYRNETHWSWSGGGLAKYMSWDVGEPEESPLQMYTCVCWSGCGWNGWHNYPSNKRLPFLCLHLILVETTMTWEHAQKYCRDKHSRLTSLVSETENLLALRKIRQDIITERVWIGLRYLSNRWLWVDKSPLVYQAWPAGGDQCPVWKRCGALTKEGLWENRDCQERLHFICH